VSPTASASENSSESTKGRSSIRLITKIAVTSTTIARTSSRPNAVIPRSKPVVTPRTPHRADTAPNSVERPVFATTASPAPLTTWVPMNRLFERPARGVAVMTTPGLFSAGVRLTGQHRLIDEQTVGLDDPAIGWYDISGREHEDIADDDVHDGDRDLSATTKNLRLDTDLGEERVHGLSGGVLLPEPQRSARGDDHQNDRPVGDVTKGHGQGGRGHQDQHDRSPELREEQAQIPMRLGNLDRVGPIASQPVRCFLWR
jgi:hypothetical protein